MQPPTTAASELRPQYTPPAGPPQAQETAPPPPPARRPFALTTSETHRAGSLPFSWKMTRLGAAAVVATLAVLLVGAYLQNRANLVELHGQRLAAIAKSALVSIPAESLDVINSRGK